MNGTQNLFLSQATPSPDAAAVWRHNQKISHWLPLACVVVAHPQARAVHILACIKIAQSTPQMPRLVLTVARSVQSIKSAEFPAGRFQPLEVQRVQRLLRRSSMREWPSDQRACSKRRAIHLPPRSVRPIAHPARGLVTPTRTRPPTPTVRSSAALRGTTLHTDT